TNRGPIPSRRVSVALATTIIAPAGRPTTRVEIPITNALTYSPIAMETSVKPRFPACSHRSAAMSQPWPRVESTVAYTDSEPPAEDLPANADASPSSSPRTTSMTQELYPLTDNAIAEMQMNLMP